MNNLEISLDREYILAGDISISMETTDAKCSGFSRYQYMLEKFKSFIKTSSSFDKHGGCTIMLFGAEVKKYEHANLSMVDTELNNVKFEPLTRTDKLIEEAFEEHKEEKSKSAQEGNLHPGTSLFIFTDGDPSSRILLEQAIVKIINTIDRQQEFNITFLTVGSITKGLQSYLKSLCNIKGVKWQIVSVFQLEKVDFVAAAAQVA